MNLKNNKLKQNQTAEYENIKRIKKIFMAFLKKRNISDLDILKISWDDLISEESKGRKWMVGSAHAAPSTRDLEETRDQMKALNSTIHDEVSVDYHIPLVASCWRSSYPLPLLSGLRPVDKACAYQSHMLALPLYFFLIDSCLTRVSRFPKQLKNIE